MCLPWTSELPNPIQPVLHTVTQIQTTRYADMILQDFTDEYTKHIIQTFKLPVDLAQDRDEDQMSIHSNSI